MRKLIFSMLAMAAWKWFTTPSNKSATRQPARRTARSTQARSAAAARSHSDVKRSPSVKRSAPKRKNAANTSTKAASN